MLAAARRTWTIILPMLPLVFVFGCSATFKYIPSDKIGVDVKPLSLKVVVTRLQDRRGQNIDHGGYCVLPLVPYEKIHYDRPEGGRPFHGPHFLNISTYDFNPTEDFAAAITRELEQNHFFDTVLFELDDPVRDADLVVSGRITKTTYDATAYCYLLGPLEGVPYLLGLPMASVTNVLDVEFVMRRAFDNAVVWSYEVKEEWSTILGVYYNTRAELNGFPLMLREGLHKGMETLANDVRTKDANYWKADVMVQPK